MATYYVRTDGNNANTGLGQTTAQAWATVAYALGSTSAGGAGLVAGDIVYVAPGVYRGAITVGMASAASAIQIIGDTLCTQFSNIPTGEIVLTVATSDSALSTTTLISATSKNFISWQNILFDGGGASINVNMSSCINWTFTKCTFSSAIQQNYTPSNIQAAYGAGVVSNLTIDRCSFFCGGCLALLNTTNATSTNVNVVIKDVFCIGPLIRQAGATVGTTTNATGIAIYNCTVINGGLGGVLAYSTVTGAVTVRNSIFIANNALESGGSGTNITEDYNRFYSNSARAGLVAGANSVTGYHALETFNRPMSGLSFSYFGSTSFQGANYNSGNSIGAPTFDMFTSNWTGANPDRGAISWTAVSQITNYQTNYAPTERNAGVITIAPGSTSQSIEMYLGSTGLTASTNNLSARYNRTRTASVSIPLVARTIAQAWTAGGFAEVDATNMPGVYRLDLPDAALAAGADDVTIVVRGASGTNGAVMTVKLSSGGLTSAQTASAVWGASPVGYNDATTFGGVVNQIDQTVTGIDSEVGDIPSNVWEELRANHTTAGTFGEYVNAELLTPITSAALVRMGPYEVKADGLGASDPLDIQKGAQHGVDIQCVDAFGSGIDITSATVTAKVYNSGATLVDTYACTATYAADGRATFVIDTTVTNTPGTYTATITRTTGASDTQVFGPLRVYVRDI